MQVQAANDSLVSETAVLRKAREAGDIVYKKEIEGLRTANDNLRRSITYL